MSGTTQWENIFHGLDTTPGKLRMSQGGLGWKPSVGEGTTITIPADHMASFQWIRVARNYQLSIFLVKDRDAPSSAQTHPRRTNFDGFVRDDFERLSSSIRQYFSKNLDSKEVSTRGWNWGQAKITNHDVQFLVRDKLAFELPPSRVQIDVAALRWPTFKPSADAGAGSPAKRSLTFIFTFLTHADDLTRQA